MKLNILYEDENVLAIDKPAGINSDNFKRRAHRLDKDTSGILLIAKDDKTLDFLQKQFKERKVEKKYLTLVVGKVKNSKGEIKTLLGREPKKRKKQKAYLLLGPEAIKKGRRLAITEYSVLKQCSDGKNFHTLIEVIPKTGRKHQIRAHLAFLGHPIVGDKLYGFKNQPCPKNLKRQFLHTSYLKIKLPKNKEKVIRSELPQNLKDILNNLK